MYRRTDYWKFSTILLIGLLIGIFVGKYTNKTPIPTDNKIILEIKKDSTLKNDSTIKIESKVVSKKVSKNTLPPLTEKNLKNELKKQGIKHPQIVLAQAKLESNLGKSKVAQRTNNLFGLRKGKRYRRFSHWTKCITAYKNLVQSRYEGGSYYAFLDKIGYAEDPNYTSKLRDMI